jgi:purine-binding chemotaxis protein CheW
MNTSSKELAPSAGSEPDQDANGSQYLTFTLGTEEYGVDILRVQEIKGWTPVTRIPNTPEYLLGVLNLRGAIVPIVDLRMRFQLDNVEHTPTTVDIVLSVKSEDRQRTLGIVVDGVSDVLNVAADGIKPTPDFGASTHTEFISGLATVQDKMVMLLDIDRLLSPRELSLETVSAIAE